MATAKRLPSSRLSLPRRILRVALALGLVLALLLAWFWTEARAYALTGTAFGARMSCACRYVQGRSLESCRQDSEPGMALVFLSDDAEAKAVTATVFPIARATATYRPGWGCLLEPWRG